MATDEVPGFSTHFLFRYHPLTETFNLASDFTKFAITAAAKLTKQSGKELAVNLNDIRA
jgi:hypothetical protein